MNMDTSEHLLAKLNPLVSVLFVVILIAGCAPNGATTCKAPADTEILKMSAHEVLNFLIKDRGQKIGTSMFGDRVLKSSRICGNLVQLEYVVVSDDPNIIYTGGPETYEIDLLTKHVALLDLGAPD